MTQTDPYSWARLRVEMTFVAKENPSLHSVGLFQEAGRFFTVLANHKQEARTKTVFTKGTGLLPSLSDSFHLRLQRKASYPLWEVEGGWGGLERA